MYELLLPNSWPKNLGAAYTRANTVILVLIITIVICNIFKNNIWLKLDLTVWPSAYKSRMLVPELNLVSLPAWIKY
jgi:hypothetical protein